MTTKLYGLVALAGVAGALWLGPARAQALFDTEEGWLVCVNNVDDPAECGPRPAPTTPPGGDTGSGAGGDTGSGAGGDTGSGAGGDAGGSTGGGSTPPPQPPQCASGKHSGHSVAASGNASGHKCGGANDQRHGHHRHDHGRHHGHAAKAKAAVHQFVKWCQAFTAHHGRR